MRNGGKPSSSLWRSWGRAPWDFICTFKRGSIPTFYDESYELLKLKPDKRLVVTTNNPDITYTYR